MVLFRFDLVTAKLMMVTTFNDNINRICRQQMLSFCHAGRIDPRVQLAVYQADR